MAEATTWNVGSPLCDGTKFRDVFATRDGFVTFKCTSCKTIFNIHIPDDLDREGDVGVGIVRYGRRPR